jgi:hypothetical protein
MKRAILVSIVALASLVGSSGVASADINDYSNNPGFQQSQTVSCNSGHGAFQFFEGSRADWIPAAARDGGIGDSTGPTNSGFAQFCKTQ